MESGLQGQRGRNCACGRHWISSYRSEEETSVTFLTIGLVEPLGAFWTKYWL